MPKNLDSIQKTIAFITPRMNIGGAETYIINKAKWLIDNQYKVIIYSAGGEFANSIPNNIRHVRIKYLDVLPTLLTRKNKFDLLVNLSNDIKKNKVDLIEAFEISPILYAIHIYKQTKTPFFLNVVSELGYKKNPLLKLATVVLESEGLYFTLNNGMNKNIENAIGVKLKRCTIIPIPVLHNTTLIPHDGNFILTVCRMAQEKMYVKQLIKDYSEIQEESGFSFKYKLIIVGDGPLFTEVKKNADLINARHDRELVEMRGNIVGEELQKLFANCSVYVGMGTTLLNASAFGKPAIIAGFETTTQNYGWGYWGYTDDDSIGQMNSNLIKDSFKNYLLEVLLNKEMYEIVSKKTRTTFDEKYSFSLIMSKWKIQYESIPEKFNTRLKNKINRSIIFLYIIEETHRIWRIIRLRKNI